jgi:hypothetical protein
VFVPLLATVKLWVYATSNAGKSAFHPNTASRFMKQEIAIKDKKTWRTNTQTVMMKTKEYHCSNSSTVRS